MSNLAVGLQMKLAELSESILAAHPRLPVLLRDIHTQLLKDPDQVTLLSEEDIRLIVTGLKQQTKTEIATSALKSKTKSAKKITLEDL